MSMHPQRSPDRVRRWLIATVLLAVFLGAYWVALQRLGAHIGDGVEQALRPVPGLDEQATGVD